MKNNRTFKSLPTYEQIEMLLTRIAEDSKIVLVGSARQCSLKPDELIKGRPPFNDIIDRLDDKDDNIAIVELNEDDIVRSKIIKVIIRCLARDDNY
jgi:phosphate starvation-inducible protein PhoH